MATEELTLVESVQVEKKSEVADGHCETWTEVYAPEYADAITESHAEFLWHEFDVDIETEVPRLKVVENGD